MEVTDEETAVNMLVISTKQKTVCIQLKQLWPHLGTFTFQSIT